MEYALEGHGYCWSRVYRDRSAWRSLPIEERARLDAQIEQLSLMRASTGVWPDRIEAPAELCASLHVRAPASPRAAIALDVASSVKEAFDVLARRLELRITHCTIEEGGADAAHLVLGAWSPAVTAEVARGDSVAAGVVIALYGDAGGGARLAVIPRIFRKVCENGAMVHDRDEPAMQVDPRLLGLGRARLAVEIGRRASAAFDPPIFAASVEPLRASAADPLDHRGGPLGALLRNALPYDQWEAVMQRYAAEAWTRWGLANAVTAEARWAGSFAEARRLERIGGALARWPGIANGEHAPGLGDAALGAAPPDAVASGAAPEKVPAT